MIRHGRIHVRLTRFIRQHFKWIIFFTFVILVIVGFHIFTVNARPISTSEEHEWLKVVMPGEQPLENAPVVISHPIGGTGNQMFQYACAYSVARTLGANLWVRAPVTPKNVSLGLSPEQRRFALENFNIEFTRPPIEDTSLLQTQLRAFGFEEPEERELLDYIYGIKKVTARKFISVRLYCESEVYFEPYKKELLESFQFNASTLDFLKTPALEKLLNEIENSTEFESVAVHIRRGDFNTVGGSFYRLLPDSYYTRAIELMKLRIENPKFYIFTDDITNARMIFGNQSNFIYVSSIITTTSLQDFLVMRKCKHLILANSSFSWWSAYLNKNVRKTVVAPLPRYKWWYVYAKYEVFKKYYLIPIFYPHEWLTLNPWD